MAKLNSTRANRFPDRAHWLDIALTLSDRHLTIAECARALGLHSSFIYRPLLDMHAAGFLESDCDREPVRGTRFWLRPDLIELAEEETRLDQPRGLLLSDQTLFLVKTTGLLELARALQDSALTRSVLWAIELNAGSDFLVALDRRHTSTTAHGRLRAALEAAGATVEDARTARVLDAESWRALLASIRDAAS